MYVFGGKAGTSAFKRKSEGGAPKMLEKSPRSHIAFIQLGEGLNLKSLVLV